MNKQIVNSTKIQGKMFIVSKCKTHIWHNPNPWYQAYEGVSKIFRTDAVKIINLTTKRVWKLPTSTQLHATWHTDSLDMAVLPSTVLRATTTAV
jgi:hypothetical protein